MPKYIVTVIVEQVYDKVITAPNLQSAEKKAQKLNIQDDAKNYVQTETMDPIVEPWVDE